MALIKCPDCGKEFSDKAKCCPNCGCPTNTINQSTKEDEIVENNSSITTIEDNKNKPTNSHKISVKVIVIGVVVITVLVAIYFLFFNLSDDERAEVQNVYYLIEQIGDVNTASASKETAIKKATTSYDELSDKCKSHVKNRRELSEARDQFDSLKAKVVDAKIEKLSNSITVDDASSIETARKEYDGLTETQKNLVKNYEILEQAETALITAEIDNCEGLIDNIGQVSLDSAETITKARDAYDALDEGQKAKINNINILTSKEDEYEKMASADCENKIKAIGTVTLDSSEAISTAEKAYSKLTASAKKIVSNYSTLTSARKAYDTLVKKKELQSIIRVSSYYCSRPNSVGGVDVYIRFTNKSPNTVSYVTFTVAPYNAVGDMVASEIGQKTNVNLQATGPYKQGQGIAGNQYWDCIWYNSTIKTIKISKIEIEYSNGSTKTISGSDVDLVIY